MPKPDPISLAAPLTVLPGVGPERAAQLARLELRTVEDLLLLRPRRYEDRRTLIPIGKLELRQSAGVQGRIVAQGVKRWQKRTRSVFEFILEDGTGRLHCRWWNAPYMESHYQVGDELVVYGRVCSVKPTAMDHPETETIDAGEERSIHLNRVVPVYPLTEGLPQRWLRSSIWRTLGTCGALVPDSWPELTRAGLPSRAQAIRALHFPAEEAEAETARRRLAMDEFIELQWALQRRRRNLQARAQALPCGGDNRLIRPFLAGLGFKLTDAQTRVLRELRQDLGGPCPMRRLLQGDVGCGKTVVAACCALMTLESGYSVALMAPTVILAEQHQRTFRGWFEPLGVPVHLRTGNAGGADPAQAEAGPALFVGTHALLEESFAPDHLGLAIIDEQHKFGVVQRERLVRKGRYPHLLVMTATPIPRTLGLTLYGDLDVSTIDALPGGRGRMRTFVREAAQLPRVFAFVRERLAEGRQAYVVCPLVEEAGGKRGLNAVTREHERLTRALAPYQVALVHGRLPDAEKDRVMGTFRANQAQVLVATSVVEVGVDVPNATVMVVEDAESFGLAQLHQLRGRIGRGAHEAYCILIAAARTPEARRRLRVLEESRDGFRIAETDLELRGPGELLGQQQSGLPRFRFGELTRDLALIEQARRFVAERLERAPADAPPTPPPASAPARAAGPGPAGGADPASRDS